MDSMLPFESTLQTISELVPGRLVRPRVGIVCGSGLSTLVEGMRDVVQVPYERLEGFGRSTGEFERWQWINAASVRVDATRSPSARP